MPPIVATSGSRIPNSLIRKFGFEPLSLAPSAPASELQGMCSVARGLALALHDGASSFAAAVMTTRCDQLRRALEGIADDIAMPFILLNLPSTHHTPASEKQEQDEMARLERFLASLHPCKANTTCSPDAAQLSMSPAHETTRQDARARLGLLACTLTSADQTVLDMLRKLGVDIVLDRSNPAMPENCPTIERRPNTAFFNGLASESEKMRLDGWVLICQPWCDIYRAEINRLKAEIPLPWLVLETGATPALASLRTRAEAFLEMIESRNA